MAKMTNVPNLDAMSMGDLLMFHYKYQYGAHAEQLFPEGADPRAPE